VIFFGNYPKNTQKQKNQKIQKVREGGLKSKKLRKQTIVRIEKYLLPPQTPKNQKSKK